MERPVIITFDKNGGETDKVPDPISRPRNVEFALPEDELSWDPQHDFLGWSEDPDATKATWKPGASASFDQDTTLYAIWYPHYLVIEGACSVWTKGSGKTHRFAADGNFKYYRKLKVDGKLVTNGVKMSSGSTVADFSAGAMEKLSVGEHTITFEYMDGETSAKFSVKAATPSGKKLPSTGDMFTPGMRIAVTALVVASFILFGAAGLVKKREN